MYYKKASDIFPRDVLEAIQQYVDGEYIYIPKKSDSKKKWGENTNIKEEYNKRNIKIYEEYKAGINKKVLAEKYFLSLKSIDRIILKQKKIK
ncbi:hypothetical protein [Clostridium paraputrificum]|uniref:Mor transcription activator family protein n=1 Tax=Clostridium paraputrificum TaxID=29363 RepID=A0A6N2Z5K3_9CLOT|nr:CD3324 family protein [Clostridium sp.]MBS5987339.1 hypothetical protein [Clostridium sp.]